jgi:hypothetical protein
LNEDIVALLEDNRFKTRRALLLLFASLDAYQPYDPAIELTPKQLEPYDALADRYVRSVECALRLFRSVEMHEFSEISPSTRGTLDRMESLGWIIGTEMWLAMRAMRNRIVHDYLPEQTAQMYQTVTGEFAAELRRLGARIGI